MASKAERRFDTSYSWVACVLSFLHNSVVGSTFMAPAIYLTDWIDEFDVTKAQATTVSSICAATVSLFGAKVSSRNEISRD